MPFREKMAWITIAAHAVVFGSYFWVLARAWDEHLGFGTSLGLMIGAVIWLIILMVASTIVVALVSPKQANAPADERERLIGLKAQRIAAYVLCALVVCLIGALASGWNGLLAANLLLGAMVISELTKAGAQIVYYRAGV